MLSRVTALERLRAADLRYCFMFLVAAHGTFISSLRLDSKKPQQVPIDSQIHFGASTRIYIIRERPQNKIPTTNAANDSKTEDVEGGLMGLPETETELDVSTIYCSLECFHILFEHLLALHKSSIVCHGSTGNVLYFASL